MRKDGRVMSPPIPVIILGSSGFLGTSLNFHLSTSPDFRVLGVSRMGSSTRVIKDYSEDSLKGVLDEENPAVVINCVGIVGHDKVETNPHLSEIINVDLPETLAKLSQERGITLVHFSSDSVYSGNPADAPFSETSTTAPFSRYGAQKLESEFRVLRANPEAIVMRINFFGWSRDGKSGMLDHFISHAILGSQPIGYSDYFATSLYTGELSRAVMAAIRAKISGVFNVGSPDSHSKLKFGQEVFSQLGLDAKRVIPGNPSIWSGEGVTSRDLSMSSQLIESTLGITLGTQIEGIDLALSDSSAFFRFAQNPGQEARQKALESLTR